MLRKSERLGLCSRPQLWLCSRPQMGLCSRPQLGLCSRPQMGLLLQSPDGALFQTSAEALLQTPDGALLQTPAGALLQTPAGALLQTPAGALLQTPDGALLQTLVWLIKLFTISNFTFHLSISFSQKWLFHIAPEWGARMQHFSYNNISAPIAVMELNQDLVTSMGPVNIPVWVKILEISWLRSPWNSSK